MIMKKVISDSERSHDYFRVIITSNVLGHVYTTHYAVRADNVSAFMDSIYDVYSNDAVIQFNGIFRQNDSRFWFTMV